MSAVLDLFNVLHDPAGVFGRLKEKPRWFVPALVIIAMLMVVVFLLKPFYIAAFQGVAASLPPERAAQMPSPETEALFGVIFTPLVVLIGLLAGAGILWVVTALTGAEGKYKMLLSVLTHAYITYLLFSVVAAAVLFTRGAEAVTSMQDLRPALGLDLLAPNAGAFVGQFLNGINLFSVWGVWLTGTGISITHGTSKGTGLTIATVSYLIGLAVMSVGAIFQGG